MVVKRYSHFEAAERKAPRKPDKVTGLENGKIRFKLAENAMD